MEASAVPRKLMPWNMSPLAAWSEQRTPVAGRGPALVSTLFPPLYGPQPRPGCDISLQNVVLRVPIHATVVATMPYGCCRAIALYRKSTSYVGKCYKKGSDPKMPSGGQIGHAVAYVLPQMSPFRAWKCNFLFRKVHEVFKLRCN